MAVRGQKPKPTFLKVVTGNPGKRPVVQDVAAHVAPGHDNGLAPPRRLKRRQQQLWDTVVRRAPWLTPFDAPKAHIWVELHAQFETDPAGMTASRIAQLRAVGNELGLDPASRARIGAGGDKKDKDPADAYFS